MKILTFQNYSSLIISERLDKACSLGLPCWKMQCQNCVLKISAGRYFRLFVWFLVQKIWKCIIMTYILYIFSIVANHQLIAIFMWEDSYLCLSLNSSDMWINWVRWWLSFVGIKRVFGTASVSISKICSKIKCLFSVIIIIVKCFKYGNIHLILQLQNKRWQKARYESRGEVWKQLQ